MGYKARALDRVERVEIANRAAWRAWLSDNHGRAEGIWLVVYKKHHRLYLPWGDIVKESLCFGWIDSVRRRVDDDRTSIYVSVRKPGSIWSGINKRHIAELEGAGLMHRAGRAKVEAAKADGSWTLLDDVEALVIPEDLASALDLTAGARAGFESLTPGAKRGLLWWIKSAKTPATRATRIDKTAASSAVGKSAIA